MEEETLITKFKGGDVEAGGILVSMNEALVHAIFERHYKSNRWAEDDFLQEGRLGLLEAFKRYDPAKSEQFKYYKSIWVRKRMNMLFKKEHRLACRKKLQEELNSLRNEPTPLQGAKHDIEFLLDYENVSAILPKKDHAKLINAAMQLKTTKDVGIYKQIGNF